MGNCSSFKNLCLFSQLKQKNINEIKEQNENVVTTKLKIDVDLSNNSSEHEYEHEHIDSHNQKMSSHYIVNFPNHEKRKESSTYRKTHHSMCVDKNIPCFICGKTQQGSHISLETHHFYCEKAAQNAIDWLKFGEFAKNCYNIQTGEYIGNKFDWSKVEENPDIFVDSEYNMIVLCKEHHISGTKGVHHVPFPNWILQKYPKDDFQFLM